MSAELTLAMSFCFQQLLGRPEADRLAASVCVAQQKSLLNQLLTEEERASPQQVTSSSCGASNEVSSSFQAAQLNSPNNPINTNGPQPPQRTMPSFDQRSTPPNQSSPPSTGPQQSSNGGSVLVKLLQNNSTHRPALPTSIATSPMDKLARENKDKPDRHRVSTSLAEQLLTRNRSAGPPPTSTPGGSMPPNSNFSHSASSPEVGQASQVGPLTPTMDFGNVPTSMFGAPNGDRTLGSPRTISCGPYDPGPAVSGAYTLSTGQQVQFRPQQAVTQTIANQRRRASTSGPTVIEQPPAKQMYPTTSQQTLPPLSAPLSAPPYSAQPMYPPGMVPYQRGPPPSTPYGNPGGVFNFEQQQWQMQRARIAAPARTMAGDAVRLELRQSLQARGNPHLVQSGLAAQADRRIPLGQFPANNFWTLLKLAIYMKYVHIKEI